MIRVSVKAVEVMFMKIDARASIWCSSETTARDRVSTCHGRIPVLSLHASWEQEDNGLRVWILSLSSPIWVSYMSFQAPGSGLALEAICNDIVDGPYLSAFHINDI